MSEVLWNMVMQIGLKQSGWVGGIALWAMFAFWAVLTIGVLVLMEGLSAFLHTLRLHWYVNKIFLTNLQIVQLNILFLIFDYLAGSSSRANSTPVRDTVSRHSRSKLYLKQLRPTLKIELLSFLFFFSFSI